MVKIGLLGCTRPENSTARISLMYAKVRERGVEITPTRVQRLYSANGLFAGYGRLATVGQKLSFMAMAII